MLDVARKLDDTGAARIAVFSAAGNRLHEVSDSNDSAPLELLPYELPALPTNPSAPYEVTIEVRGYTGPFVWTKKPPLKAGSAPIPQTSSTFILSRQYYDLVPGQLIELAGHPLDDPNTTIEHRYRLRGSALPGVHLAVQPRPGMVLSGRV